MAGCKSTLSGEDFYGAYDAQDKAAEHAPELGMQTVPSLNIAYTQEKGYVTADVAKAEGLTTLNLSGAYNAPGQGGRSGGAPCTNSSVRRGWGLRLSLSDPHVAVSPRPCALRRHQVPADAPRRR